MSAQFLKRTSFSRRRQLLTFNNNFRESAGNLQQKKLACWVTDQNLTGINHHGLYKMV